MRRVKPLSLTLLLVLLASLFAAPAQADGIVVPEPPICDPGPCPGPFPLRQLVIEEHHVRVTIQDQVAVTRVDQTFRNDNDWAVEGTYIFPLPTGAAVSEFKLWIDGEPVEGKVLTSEEARRTYEEIVRTMRDPALLEYVGNGAVQASIFPIPPGGKRRIQLEYVQVLPAENGLVHYRYPLNTEKFSAQPLQQVSVSVSIQSPQPIRAVYSPSHQVDIFREDDYSAQLGYEAADVLPDRDFELYYSVGESPIGLNLITTREGDEGYFLLLAAPGVEAPDQVVEKDVLLVLDRSGSMEGEKFRQAQEALRYVLEHLNPGDRFNVLTFSTGLRGYASGMQPAEEARQAIRWVEAQSAQGSTDINRALLEAAAMADRERPTLLIFLTDGLPTEGVTDSGQILDNLDRSAPGSLRLFTFGVGYDVDTFLLDSLAQAHHGASSYVTPDQAIDEAVSAFYDKVSAPVLTDLRLDFGDITVYDLYPDPLPDLFAGGQLILVGRYRDAGRTTIRLEGSVEGRTQTFTYRDQRFAASGGPAFLPRLWATRKVGALLQSIRLQGPDPELVDQVVRLSIRYGIVTPYTSYLVTEPDLVGAEAQQRFSLDAQEKFMAAAPEVSGQAAVERAASEGAIADAEVPLAPGTEAAEVIRIAGSHTFRLVEGVWMDTAFDPESMQPRRVPFLSRTYFDLAAAHPDLAAAFALGPQVIVVTGDEAYQVVSSEVQGDLIPASQVEPEELPAEASSGASALPLPCPGAFLGLGLLWLPLRRRVFREGRVG